MDAELNLPVAESSNSSSHSVVTVESTGSLSITDAEPPAWVTAVDYGREDTSFSAQQQLKHAQASSEPQFEHLTRSSSRPLPHVAANQTIMNGHQALSIRSAAAAAAPSPPLRDGLGRRQRSDTLPPDDSAQPEASQFTLPVAVRTFVHPHFNQASKRVGGSVVAIERKAALSLIYDGTAD